MKKLSEVTKLTGVSRRALQEYDRLDLVNPSGKTEAGYWLYDDEAIERILFIQMLAEVGYERKRIKQIIDASEFDFEKEISNAIKMLEDKRSKINGMINIAKQWQMAAKMPKSTLMAMGHADLNRLYQEINFADAMKNSINELAEFTDEEMKEAEKYSPIYFHLLAIGCMKDKDPRTKLVQNCIHEFFRFFIDLAEEDEKDEDKYTEEEIYTKEFADDFVECMKEIFWTDKEFVDLLSAQCGEGVIDFINNALEVFKVLVAKNYWKKTE